MTMKTYKINWNSTEYGYAIIEANNKEEAKELFYSGEYKNENFTIKDGCYEVDGVYELDNG